MEVEIGNRKSLATAFVPGLSPKSFGKITAPLIFARGQQEKPGFNFGKDRYPIGTLNSNSVATMALNSKSIDKYMPLVNKFAAKRFEHHVNRLIENAARK